MKKAFCLLVAIALLWGSSGCWDRVELQERALILAAGIDQVPAREAPEEESSRAGSRLDARYSLILTTPIFARDQSQNQSGFKFDEKLMASTAPTLFEANRQMALRSGKELFYNHLQAVVISADAARNNLEAVIDFFERDPEMNRNMVILFTPEKARDILAFKPDLENSIGSHLKKTAQNQEKTARTVESDLNTFLVDFHGTGNALAARVIPGKDDVRFSGAAVIVEKRFKGWLNEIEARAAQFLRGDVRGGAFTIDDPTTPGEFVTIEIKRAAVKVKPIISDERIWLVAEVSLIADIVDVSAGRHTIDAGFIQKVQTAGAASIKKEIDAVVRKAQEELHGDIFRFSGAVSRTNPRWWNRNKDRWNNTFSRATVDVDVELTIRRTGNIR